MATKTLTSFDDHVIQHSVQRTESKQLKWVVELADCSATWRPCSPTHASPSRTCRRTLWSAHENEHRRKDSPTSQSICWTSARCPTTWRRNLIGWWPKTSFTISRIRSKRCRASARRWNQEVTSLLSTTSFPATWRRTWPTKKQPPCTLSAPSCVSPRATSSPTQRPWEFAGAKRRLVSFCSRPGWTCWVWQDQGRKIWVLRRSVCVKSRRRRVLKIRTNTENLVFSDAKSDNLLLFESIHYYPWPSDFTTVCQLRLCHRNVSWFLFSFSPPPPSPPFVSCLSRISKYIHTQAQNQATYSQLGLSFSWNSHHLSGIMCCKFCCSVLYYFVN